MHRRLFPPVDDLGPDARADLPKLGEVAASAGLARVHFLAWRDLDDPEAGGSELHAHEVARRWAAAGIEVNFRTSFAAGHSQVALARRLPRHPQGGSLHGVPRAAFSEMMGWHGTRDGLVEIWNGMPFFSPLWARGPRIVFLHHVHAEMWDMVLAAAPRPARAHGRIAHRAADLPVDPHRHALGVLEARARRRARFQGEAGRRRRARYRPEVLTRRRALARAAARRGRAPRAGQALPLARRRRRRAAYSATRARAR